MLGHGLRGEFEIYFKLSTQSGDVAARQGEIEIAKITNKNVSGIQVSALET